MEGVFVNQPNIQLMYETMAQILGERYGAKITVTVKPRNQEDGRLENHHEESGIG